MKATKSSSHQYNSSLMLIVAVLSELAAVGLATWAGGFLAKVDVCAGRQEHNHH